MNPEDLDLPQPPEGVLHPTMPWSRINPNSRLWLILKSKLTGRRQGDESYTSYVNLTDADADRLIENIKKDPRGYPSLDQESGTPIEWMERQRIYQEWLVEEYLEKPFRKRVDEKILDAQTRKKVDEILETFNKKKSENIIIDEKLFPLVIDPWQGSETPSSQIIVIQPNEEARKTPLLLPPATSVVEEIPIAPVIPSDSEDVTDDIDIDDVGKAEKQGIQLSPVPLPKELPQELRNNFVSVGKNFDKISRSLSAQNILIRRNIFKQKKVSYSLSIIEQLIQDQIENYVEAISDFEMRQIEITSETPNITAPKPEPQEQDIQSQTEVTPQPSVDKQSEGIVSYRPVVPGGKILTPGIYDNPTIGQLLPGFAVIPYNRNYGKQILNQYDMTEYRKALLSGMLQPMRYLVAGAAAKIGEVVTSFGAFAPFFVGSFSRLVDPLSSLLGISKASATELLGGEQYVTNKKLDKKFPEFFGLWKSTMKENNWIFATKKRPQDSVITGEGEGESPPGQEAEWAGGLDTRTPASYNPYDDTDGQETGIDISLSGKGTNGYGRGLTIRNPWENLYYFDKVPAGFLRAGEPTRGIQGSAERNKVSGFGHWATYYIKDNDGSWYEILIGHLDKRAPTWNDTGSGVLLNQGVKIGVQGASGSTSSNITPDGTYDHMTTHINSGGRNRRRAGQLLLQWARDLNAYKPVPPQPPSQPSFQSGGFLKTINQALVNVQQSLKNTFSPNKGLRGASLKRIMHGTAEGIPDLIRKNGFRGQTGMLGSGVYGSTKGWVADTYRGAGKWKGILPGQGPRLDMLVPQASRTLRGATVVSERQANRGLRIAEGILSGKYTGAKAQQLLPLLTETTPTMAKAVGTGALKLAGKGLGILNAPLIGDMLFPEPTAAGTLDHAMSQGWVNPQSYSPPVTAQQKTTPTIVNYQSLPSQQSITQQTTSTSNTPSFIQTSIPTRQVMSSTHGRRL